MTKIVFYDSTKQDKISFKKLFAKEKGFSLEFVSSPLDKDNANLAASADILSVFVKSKADSFTLAKLAKLKMIAARSTGFDHIDLNYCHENSIRVCNVPSYGENTVAEYAFLLMLSLSRKLKQTLSAIDQAQIDHTKLTGFDLKNKALGVIGTGRIGSHMIKIAKGFEMNIIAYDPYPNQQLANEYNFDYVSLEDLLKSSDIITLHVPGSKENTHLINSKNLKLVKKDAIIINAARGDLIDTKALIDALVEKRILGAGLDVIEGENLLDMDDEISLLSSKDKKQLNLVVELTILEKMPNVILTAHNAFNSEQALERIRQTTKQNIIGYLENKPSNQVY